MKPNLHPKKCMHLLALLLMACCGSHAQDIHFSQFFETPLLRNPSLAGIFTGDIRVQSVYRSQWNNVTDAYRTVSFNFESRMPIGRNNDYLTLGGQIFYDKAGTIAMTSTHVLPVLNYHKSLSTEKNSYLSVGFLGGIVQRRIDQSKITTNSQYNGSIYDANMSNGEKFNRPSYSYLDATVGMSYNSQLGENEDNNIYFGLAYQHLNKAPTISFYGNPEIEMAPKWVGSFGLRMNMTDASFFTIYGDYSQQAEYKETMAGMLYSYKLDDIDAPRYVLHGGAFMRLKDAMIPTLKLDIDKISIGVSYDANFSQLRNVSRGSGGYEFSLSYQGFRNAENASDNSTRCPAF